MITKSQVRPGKSDPTPRPAPKGNWTEPLGIVTPLGGNWSDPLGRNWSCPLGSSPIGGLGYHPDLPDHRDCGWKQLGDFLKETTAAKNERVKGLLERVEDKAPDKFNLGDDAAHPLPPIENQGRTNSCTANAAVGLVEYLYRWATGSYNDFHACLCITMRASFSAGRRTRVPISAAHSKRCGSLVCLRKRSGRLIRSG